MRDYLAVLFWWRRSWNYLLYPVEMTSQSNNDTVGYRIIDKMMFPHIWLVQRNITDIKRGNITHYLILEGMDAIGQVTLLVDGKIGEATRCCMDDLLE